MVAIVSEIDGGRVSLVVLEYRAHDQIELANYICISYRTSLVEHLAFFLWKHIEFN